MNKIGPKLVSIRFFFFFKVSIYEIIISNFYSFFFFVTNLTIPKYNNIKFLIRFTVLYLLGEIKGVFYLIEPNSLNNLMVNDMHVWMSRYSCQSAPGRIKPEINEIWIFKLVKHLTVNN